MPKQENKCSMCHMTFPTGHLFCPMCKNPGTIVFAAHTDRFEQSFSCFTKKHPDHQAVLIAEGQLLPVDLFANTIYPEQPEPMTVFWHNFHKSTADKINNAENFLRKKRLYNTATVFHVLNFNNSAVSESLNETLKLISAQYTAQYTDSKKENIWIP